MKCDYCKNKAVVNYQDVIVKYPIKNEEYGEMEVAEDFGAGQEINYHLCKKHEEKFLNDEL